MAVILGRAYPELYAAVGVHSGLPAGAAYDLRSALEATRVGPFEVRVNTQAARPVSTIVFHGDCDTTVHPLNGPAVLTQAQCDGASMRSYLRSGRTSTRTVTRTIGRRTNGGPDAQGELWIVHGGGHSWAGGDRLGSFTDESGPDASREMGRFFLKQRLPVPAEPVRRTARPTHSS